MSSGFRRAVSILWQGRTPLLAAVAVIGAICMSGCSGTIPRLTSSYREIVPGTVPVDTFLTDDMYKAVRIGGVTWMAENLNIENGKSWCFDDKIELCDVFGRLYDWKTAMKICPPGWHLPSRQEWVDLEAMAGGSEVASKRLRSKDKVFSGTEWEGTDDYGFGALPAGWGRRNDILAHPKFIGCSDNWSNYCTHGWWTSTECDADWTCGKESRLDSDGRGKIKSVVPAAIFATLNERFRHEGIANVSADKWDGLSVRCILDE